MTIFYLHLVEHDRTFEDQEGVVFADDTAAQADAIRQIRHMVSCEILETGLIDLHRAIDVAGPDGTRRIAFAEAIRLKS